MDRENLALLSLEFNHSHNFLKGPQQLLTAREIRGERSARQRCIQKFTVAWYRLYVNLGEIPKAHRPIWKLPLFERSP